MKQTLRNGLFLTFGLDCGKQIENHLVIHRFLSNKIHVLADGDLRIIS
jgi:hypothetical protein